MDIRQLEYLAALAEERHFTRAATRCNVTQPTLSGRIRQLEDELGVAIVERGQRYHGLTTEGEHVLRWARVIIGDRAALMQELSELKGGLAGRITLGVIPSALPMVASVTSAVRAQHPAVTFAVRSLTSRAMLRDVEEFRIDAGITYLDNEPLTSGERLVTEPLYTERYRLFVPVDHPWADLDSVSWAEAAGLPLVLLTPDMQNRRIINQHLKEAGAAPNTTIESNSMILLFAHIRTGKWASIMPLNLAETLGFAEPIRAIPIVEPDASHLVGVVAVQREPHTPMVSALLYEARQAAQTLGEL